MINALSLAALSFAFASTSATAASPSQCAAVATYGQKADEETIKRIESAWLGAEYRGEVAFLDCLLDPGYSVIRAKTGEVKTKADLLERVAKNKGKTPDVPPLATIAIVNGSFATAYSSMTGKKENGETYEAHFVDSYVFRDGAWHAVGGVDL